jgi:hypothetical protein
LSRDGRISVREKGRPSEKVARVKAGFKWREGHRLHANDGVLRSFGIEQLACFDGKQFTEVKHPGNK